jgi:hypothetical protein
MILEFNRINMERSSLEADADNLSQKEPSSTRLKEITKEKIPNVLMFQPTRYFEVPADRLQEWEKLLKERIGIPESVKFSLPNNAMACVTCSPCADDCGYGSVA